MSYDVLAYQELKKWQRKMVRKPSFLNNFSRKIQTKVNSYIPEKIHKAITATIKQMIKGVLFGAKYTSGTPTAITSLQITEAEARLLIEKYKKTAAAEGGITGAGGILLGFVDFPVLLGIKLKMLFDLATLYGFDVKDYKERLYILYIFELAFSSQQHRREVYQKLLTWERENHLLPEDLNAFDWRSFQQEYRDYIDLAKMAQLIPGIGAVVGLVVNYRLLNQLSVTAVNAYRLRYFQK